jgi:signal transduction histidine kinase/uncharacterized protein YdeI (BOF family)
MTLARSLKWLAAISLLFSTCAKARADAPESAATLEQAKAWAGRIFGVERKSAPAGPRKVTIAEALGLLGKHERVTVTGTIAFEWGPGMFYLYDGTGKIRVFLSTLIVVKPGDLVEVNGQPVSFQPEWGLRVPGEPGFPYLGDAKAIIRGAGVFPTPVALRAGDAYASEAQRAKYDAEFVTLRGRVVRHYEHSSTYLVAGGFVEFRRFYVEVDDGGRAAKIEFKSDVNAKVDYPVGSVVDFTGACDLENRIGSGRPDRITICVPGPAFAKVVELPPFWSRSGVQQNARMSAIAAFGVLALVVAWLIAKWRLVRRANVLLEARVAARTTELQLALATERELGDLKGNFVSMVSHEFRTPLGVIGSSAQILDRYFTRLSDEDRREHLDNITSGVQRMARMLEDVLVLSRVDSGRMDFRPESLQLGELCRRIADEMHSLHGGTVLLAVAPDAETCPHADENLLRHILTNLLINAHKYSPPSSPVQLTVARERSDAVFSIRNEGIGIPLPDQNRLFEAFHRGSNVGQIAGTGLGLVIVRRCSEIHGGTVAVASSESAGATFTVRLPVWTELTSR